ncbi:LPXTG cell wall anchor domain-containing protein [Staphylococcus epidermidis]|uniref:LPXTG cell wall anchor domain-containing protein n=1 Tax=Staphylococcus epidermidis TaxID=1282 RepID=UPI000C16E18A|nr:LPXTG cell wall anchor domain-containing protein [Staphylococcus epidermidis]ATQ49391.1 cell surface protein [Staphylococcus epidermidis]MCG1130301.1 LPXTG cell wall anchor domain-containing protein [Staphylococcus epidermidis]MCG1263496.1 LPXTG cell wall anchor domain-containing protein [Staphylococcus epidermidis]MCG1303931.1 LPXTG cell wall anchor domain-containing protein [Staphylococcus epidermidis]MCG1362110.1 LPXTG cell wall anchor domain-containing protein [Staphylococcus epidermidi
MKDIKPNNSKLIQTYLSKKTIRYGTASALTLALYLFNSNVTVYADENTANQGTSPKTSQTAPTNNNENTDATAVTTDQNNNDEEEYDASYELPILYVTVWLDDQGNIIKDAVEDAKTPASERQPVKIPGYQHYRTSVSDGITKFIYRKISTAQSPIVENSQQNNNTNKVVETTNQNKDEVNGKEQNQANTSVTNTQITKNEKDEDTNTPQKDKDEKDTKTPKKDREEKSPVIPKSGKDEKESKDRKTPKKDKKEKITKTPKKDREEKKPVIPSNGKVEKDEDRKTPKKDKKEKITKTSKKDKEEKSPVIPKSGKDEKKSKDTKITKKDKEDEITTTSKKDNNNDVQDKLPETGKTNDIQNPALIMLLAGLGLLGLFRNKIRE